MLRSGPSIGAETCVDTLDVGAFHQADPETQAAYRVGLMIQRNLDSNPITWVRTRCGTSTPGDEILISYDVGDTPIPYCPA